MDYLELQANCYVIFYYKLIFRLGQGSNYYSNF